MKSWLKKLLAVLCVVCLLIVDVPAPFIAMATEAVTEESAGDITEYVPDVHTVSNA